MMLLSGQSAGSRRGAQSAERRRGILPPLPLPIYGAGEMIKTKRGGAIEIIGLVHGKRPDGNIFVDQVKVVDRDGFVSWVPLRIGISIFEDKPGEIEEAIKEIEEEIRRRDGRL